MNTRRARTCSPCSSSREAGCQSTFPFSGFRVFRVFRGFTSFHQKSPDHDSRSEGLLRGNKLVEGVEAKFHHHFSRRERLFGGNYLVAGLGSPFHLIPPMLYRQTACFSVSFLQPNTVPWLIPSSRSLRRYVVPHAGSPRRCPLKC